VNLGEVIDATPSDQESEASEVEEQILKES
jgi:hypothetical protein